MQPEFCSLDGLQQAEVIKLRPSRGAQSVACFQPGLIRLESGLLQLEVILPLQRGCCPLQQSALDVAIVGLHGSAGCQVSPGAGLFPAGTGPQSRTADLVQVGDEPVLRVLDVGNLHGEEVQVPEDDGVTSTALERTVRRARAGPRELEVSCADSLDIFDGDLVCLHTG